MPLEGPVTACFSGISPSTVLRGHFNSSCHFLPANSTPFSFVCFLRPNSEELSMTLFVLSWYRSLPILVMWWVGCHILPCWVAVFSIAAPFYIDINTEQSKSDVVRLAWNPSTGKRRWEFWELEPVHRKTLLQTKQNSTKNQEKKKKELQVSGCTSLLSGI